MHQALEDDGSVERHKPELAMGHHFIIGAFLSHNPMRCRSDRQCTASPHDFAAWLACISEIEFNEALVGKLMNSRD